MNKYIRILFFTGFIFIILCISGCDFIPIYKFLTFTNGSHASKIVIIDNNKAVEYNIEPDMDYGWSDNLIGDFRFIYIKTDNEIEGIFIINNEFKRKVIPYDIISKKEQGKKLKERFENNVNLYSPYHVIVRIIEDKFEIEYDNTKYKIFSYFSYNQNYISEKEKYMRIYNYKE